MKVMQAISRSHQEPTINEKLYRVSWEKKNASGKFRRVKSLWRKDFAGCRQFIDQLKSQQPHSTRSYRLHED